MSNITVTPRSRLQIQEIARTFRKSVAFLGLDKFPIVEFLELVWPRINPDFHCVIVEEAEMPREYAKYYPENSMLKIRQDVYLGAINGRGRHRFTLAHELGHAILHGQANFARSETKPKAFENPEWQADEFAAELICPVKEIRGLSPFEISKKYGVSYQVAEIQLNKI